MKKLAGTLLSTLLALGSALPASAATSPYQFRSTSIQVDAANGVKYKYITAENFAYQGTTWVPIYYLIEAMRDAGASASWDGSTKTFTFSDPFATGSVLPVHSGNVNLLLNGTVSPFHASRIITRDPQSGVLTTYMRLYDLQSILTAYGIDSVWDGSVTPDTWKLPKFYDPIPQASQLLGSNGESTYYLVSGYSGTFDAMTLMGSPFVVDKYYLLVVLQGQVEGYQEFDSKPTILTESDTFSNGAGSIIAYDSKHVAIASTGASVYGDSLVKISLPLPSETIQSLQYVSPGSVPNLDTNDPAIQIVASDGFTYFYDANTGSILAS